MTLSPFISLVLSLLFSCVGFYFTFKMNAHRIRLKNSTFRHRYIDTITINNDSSFAVRLSAVGHIDSTGKITWMKHFTDSRTNRDFEIPALIEGRSTLFGMIPHNVHTFPHGTIYGFCAQLSCGRTFVSRRNLPLKLALKLKFKELISRISSGKRGFPMSDIQYRDYI